MRLFALPSVVLLSLFAPIPAVAIQQPIGSLRLLDFADEREFILLEPLTYTIGYTQESITVPAGFVTDMASIPPALRSFLNLFGRYGRAAVVHDYLYWSGVCTRTQADNLLMIAMKESQVSPFQRFAIYQGVHGGGKGPWRQNEAERLAGKPKVVPANRWAEADSKTWPQLRQALIAEGVRDPAPVLTAGACPLGDRRDVPGRPPR